MSEETSYCNELIDVEKTHACFFHSWVSAKLSLLLEGRFFFPCKKLMFKNQDS